VKYIITDQKITIDKQRRRKEAKAYDFIKSL